MPLPFAARPLTGLPLAVFTTALLGWLGVYFDKPLRALAASWRSDEYSHAPLLLIIAFFWGLRLLQEQTDLPPRATWRGLLWITGGLALGYVCQVIANYWGAQIALLLALTGYIYMLCGGKTLRVLAPALGLLLVSLPLPPTLAAQFTAKMQLLSTDFGVALLHLLGHSAYQDGNIIEIGAAKLYVAEACSGLRYFFPLIAIGYLIAFHAFRDLARRALFLLATLPIALIGNGLRIAATGAIADRYGLKPVEGALHEIEGYLVFAFCLLCLGALYKILRPRLNPPAPARLMPTLTWPPLQLRAALSLPLALTLLTLMLGFAPLFGGAQPQTSRPLPQRLATFPAQLGPWRAVHGTLSADEMRSLRLDDYLLAAYTAPDQGAPITFYIAHYNAQEQGRAIHSPEICLPGGGWALATRSVRSLPLTLPGDTHTLRVTREILTRGPNRQLVYYWFNEGGRFAATNSAAKIELLRSALGAGRTDGSLLRVSTDITPRQNEAEAEAALTAFLAQALPHLPAALALR